MNMSLNTAIVISQGNDTNAPFVASEWSLSVTRNMSFWHQWLSAKGHYWSSVDFGVNARLRQCVLTEHGTTTHFFAQDENYSLYVQAVLDAVKDASSLHALMQAYDQHAKSALSAMQSCVADTNTTTWDSFTTAYARFAAGLMITATIGRSGGEKLIARLTEIGVPPGDIPQTVEDMTYPAVHTPLFQSQIDLLRIGKCAQESHEDSAQQDASLEEWLCAYRAIPVNFCDEPWTIDDARSQLRLLMQKDCNYELVLMQESHEARAKRAKEMRERINDPEVTHWAEVMSVATTLNESRKNAFSVLSLGYRPVFQDVVRRSGADEWRDCFYLTDEEMRRIIGGEQLKIQGIKSERATVGFFVRDDGERIFLGPEDLKLLANRIRNSPPENLKSTGPEHQLAEIRGFSASKGKTRGVVRVILNSRDFHKFQDGDVLVTTMTSVDFVPIMARACAFVTNEGGITSHASIVAREMKKPCIIGTKIATQVLKDGDMVEVDAERGVVQILK